ncbi:hypothetical protein BV25DRAFT_1831203 [Artomyces pyxidatus]|uniref:Uncharacterized protein n=1 Tax=Artomyces pyxidatus TaxID=48021 RepID=A0ACB8SMP5_9AGAM|nr:hypothetical protein BV25DRAFT_1831203 [Artomyces pyxidatus]
MRMFQDVVVLRNQVDSLQKAYNDLLAIVAQTQTHSFGDCDHGFAIKRHDREHATKRRAPSPEYPIVKKARTHSPPLFFHAPISSISSSFAEEYRLASLSAHNAEQYPTKVEPHPIPVPVHTKPVAVPFSVRDTNILESAAPISRKNPQTLSIQASRPIKRTGSLASTVRFDPAASAPSKRRIRMRASNSTTARNLYAKDYLKEHPDTTAQEFAEVWHVLDERIRSLGCRNTSRRACK